MKKLFTGFAAGLAVAIFLLAGAAHAGTIAIFNTGVDANGVPLPDGTVGDPHYTLIAVPSGTTTDIQVLTSARLGTPCDAWNCGGSLSAWIGPNTGHDANGVNGDSYTYRTTFSLSGFDPATALLTGQWLADNQIVNILLNGMIAGPSGGGFQSWSPFMISSNFVAGVNTLDFIVYNGGGPTGLRAEVAGTATNNVPIPAGIWLLGSGLIGLVGFRRKFTSYLTKYSSEQDK